jgi:hypothetical protein
MNTREQNYTQVRRYLIAASVGLSAASILVKGQPWKGICLGLAATFLIGALTVIVVYKMKPGTYRDKSPNPDEFPD